MELLFAKIDQLILIKTFLVASGGLLVFYIHSFILFSYFRSPSYLFTSILLPPIAMIITSVISSNLALSLGMIGALSIVRYRTPIKSVYELALLFFLITLGVTASVNIKYAIFLITIIIFFPIVLKILFKFNFLKIQHLVISDVDKYVEANYLFNNTLSEINNEINLDNHIQNIDEDYDNRSTEIMMKFDNMEDHLKIKNKIDLLKALKVKNVSVSKRN
jgi:hypothetical protein